MFPWSTNSDKMTFRSSPYWVYSGSLLHFIHFSKTICFHNSNTRFSLQAQGKIFKMMNNLKRAFFFMERYFYVGKSSHFAHYNPIPTNIPNFLLQKSHYFQAMTWVHVITQGKKKTLKHFFKHKTRYLVFFLCLCIKGNWRNICVCCWYW